MPRIGNVQRVQSNKEAALAYHVAAMAIVEKLAVADPGNANLKLDLLRITDRIQQLKNQK